MKTANSPMHSGCCTLGCNTLTIILLMAELLLVFLTVNGTVFGTYVELDDNRLAEIKIAKFDKKLQFASFCLHR